MRAKDAVQSLCHCLRPPVLEAYFEADQGCKTKR